MGPTTGERAHCTPSPPPSPCTVGDRDTARAEAHDGAVAAARRLGIPTLLATALAIQGHVAVQRRPPRALAAIDEAIGLFEAGAGDTLYSLSLIDAAVLRAVAGDMVGAARGRPYRGRRLRPQREPASLNDAIAVATVVLAAYPERLEAAAILDGTRHGPVIGHFPPTWSVIHQPRIDAAVEHVASGLGPDAFATPNAVAQR